MSPLPVVEVALQLRDFRNVDLFHQGLYRLHLCCYQESFCGKTSSQEEDISPGAARARAGLHVLPGGGSGSINNTSSSRNASASGKFPTTGGGSSNTSVHFGLPVHKLTKPSLSASRLTEITDPHVLPAEISTQTLASGSYLSSAFLIRYCEEEVALDEGVVFRLELDEHQPVIVEAELLYADLTEFGGPEAAVLGETTNFDASRAIFKSACRRKLKLWGCASKEGLHEFAPVLFDEFHCSVCRIFVHACAVDVRHRVRRLETLDPLSSSAAEELGSDDVIMEQVGELEVDNIDFSNSGLIGLREESLADLQEGRLMCLLEELEKLLSLNGGSNLRRLQMNGRKGDLGLRSEEEVSSVLTSDSQFPVASVAAQREWVRQFRKRLENDERKDDVYNNVGSGGERKKSSRLNFFLSESQTLWGAFLSGLTSLSAAQDAVLRPKYTAAVEKHWGTLIFCEEIGVAEREELWITSGDPAATFERAAKEIRGAMSGKK